MRDFGPKRLSSGALTACAALAMSSFLFLALYVERARAAQEGGGLAIQRADAGGKDWPAYGGAPDDAHYSSLAQINRANVKELQVAWSFDTGEVGGLETSPLIVNLSLIHI